MGVYIYVMATTKEKAKAAIEALLKVLADLKELPELIEFMLDKLHRAGYPVGDNGEIHPSLEPEIGICWQYSSKGKVPGIVGNVDMDLAKVDISKIKEKKESLVEKILEILRKIISRFLV